MPGPTVETLRQIRDYLARANSNIPSVDEAARAAEARAAAAEATAAAEASHQEFMRTLREFTQKNLDEKLAKHKPQKTRFKNESSFRVAVIKALGKKAFLAQAIESTTASGIPDVYAVGIVNGTSKPCWAELKVVKRGNVAKVTALQWKWLTDHAKASGNSYLMVNDHSHGGIWVLKVTCQALPNLRDMKYIRSSSYQLKKSPNPLDDLVNAL